VLNWTASNSKTNSAIFCAAHADPIMLLAAAGFNFFCNSNYENCGIWLTETQTETIQAIAPKISEKLKNLPHEIGPASNFRITLERFYDPEPYISWIENDSKVNVLISGDSDKKLFSKDVIVEPIVPKLKKVYLLGSTLSRINDIEQIGAIYDLKDAEVFNIGGLYSAAQKRDWAEIIVSWLNERGSTVTTKLALEFLQLSHDHYIHQTRAIEAQRQSQEGSRNTVALSKEDSNELTKTPQFGFNNINPWFESANPFGKKSPLNK